MQSESATMKQATPEKTFLLAPFAENYKAKGTRTMTQCGTSSSYKTPFKEVQNVINDDKNYTVEISGIGT